MKTFDEWLDDQDGRMWSCDVCGEVCFDETCDRGHEARPLSGQVCYELGLLEDEAIDYQDALDRENEDGEDEDESQRYYAEVTVTYSFEFEEDDLVDFGGNADEYARAKFDEYRQGFDFESVKVEAI